MRQVIAIEGSLPENLRSGKNLDRLTADFDTSVSYSQAHRGHYLSLAGPFVFYDSSVRQNLIHLPPWVR